MGIVSVNTVSGASVALIIASALLAGDEHSIYYTVLKICLQIVSTFSQLALGAFGFNSYVLLFRLFWYGKSKEETPTMTHSWPAVTVQLPIYNERFVIQRLIKKCLAFDYPSDKLEIQVLDDSTDGSAAEVKAFCESESKNTKVKLTYINRKSRTNYKAGALVVGTSQAKGEFLAIFDADFMPEADFLKRTMPYFYQDEKIGCVQTRWGHMNYDYSMLTKLQAIGHDGHFMVEQAAKSASGLLFNFNGTAGIWRRDCIIEAGDWSGDTLAEDLDLSYRAQLKGWKMKFVRDVEVPAEVPLSISAFKKQQSRWAKGSIQTAIKLTSSVCTSDKLTLIQKYMAIVHLFGYACHPLMVLNLLCTIALFFTTAESGFATLVLITCLMAIGPPLVVCVAEVKLGHPERIFLLPLLIILHNGLCLNNSFAVLEAVVGKKTPFERTPKFGNMQTGDKWTETEYAKALQGHKLPWAEIFMCAILLCCMLLGVQLNVATHSYPWLFIFLAAFLSIIFQHYREIQTIRNMVCSTNDNMKKM